MNDQEFRELVERCFQIQQLTQHKGWDSFVDRAVHQIAAKQKRVLGGRVTSLEDYKHYVGWIEGANFVLSLPELVATELQAERERRGELEGPDAA